MNGHTNVKYTTRIQQTVNALLLNQGIQLSLQDDVCQHRIVK